MGDFGNDFFFILVSAFLMVFYTDIFHIHPELVGVLFFVARLWDAVADFAWGRFIDTRKPTKHGKFKPWILRMSFPLVLSGVLMFVTIPGMSDGFYLAWAFVTDVIDYHEYLTDMREDATVYSIYSMARKIGQGIAGGIGGYAMGAVGYNAALGQQSEATLDGIYSLATLVPAIFYLLIFLILVFLYPLNKKRTLQLTADLAARRSAR